MNRLTMLHESFNQNYSSIATLPTRAPVLERSIELEFPYRLFVPENYEPGYAYPLVVWLHSDASSELELDHVMPALSLRNYIAIAPRGNVKSRGSQRRYRWGTTLTDCAVAEDLVWDSVQAAMNVLSIHSDRIFLAGFGGGGTMAQWIGLKYAAQLAGVVSLTGAVPKTSRVLSNWKIARSLKVLFAQRQGSTICSEDDMMRAVRFAHQSGLDYRFLQAQSEDDTEGNELDAGMLQAANRFMMGIVTGTDLSLSPETSYDSEIVEFGFN